MGGRQAGHARSCEPDHDPLAGFGPATRTWFTEAFERPTPAQQQAWEAIGRGDDTLVVAPTGSGKTLAAFLTAIDRLTGNRPSDADTDADADTETAAQAGAVAHGAAVERPAGGSGSDEYVRVLYVSPLKALAADVDRNLRRPLRGIAAVARREGGTAEPPRAVTVGVRTGDTPPDERRRLSAHPPDILITTPESLFLMLTSRARESLARVEMVIIDEIHSLAGTKRGAHLAVSLERLDARLPRRAQRVGLSATVRPLEEVARYLGGNRPVTTVAPPASKSWDLRVVVPVEDMGALGQAGDDLSGPAAGDPRRTSIWPHVEERLVDLVVEHTSTLVFANSRRLAERLTTRINEIWQERLSASGATDDGTAVLARAHHGSVSREQRSDIEEALKAGRLPAVVATSSLELGIDMGDIDLVAQVESPPSVAGGLQRVGRAGHQVGAVSRGVFFPKYRGDLLQSAVVAERMRSGLIEAVQIPANPLDVLAQQLVAMCAMDEWHVDDALRLLRRAASFATLSSSVLESVLDMLAGRYPSEEFAELRPRIVWDRSTDVLSGRPGAQRLAVTSGGTIPDRGLFGVFLAGEGPGRRVGELDEEMVYESRVGDVFTLGTSSWRIHEITHDQVLVVPAPGEPGKLPFWKGDAVGRAAELGAAVGAFAREVASLPAAEAGARLRSAGLDDWAAENLVAYLAEQALATRVLPSDTSLVLERFRDELGDWRIVLHSPFGSRVHAPWALCIAARLRERYGFDVQAMHGDDGIVLRLPDMEPGDDVSESAFLGDLAGIVMLEPEEVTASVTAAVGGSALFASRFRECAGRALLLPRLRPDKRSALWQQRHRSAQLLQVASRYPEFPIVLEAVRECLQDVFDVPALTGLMRDLAARRVQLITVDTESPSPFARNLLFGYVAQFLYEGDSPLAERRAAALSLDPTLLAELLGGDTGIGELLEPQIVTLTESELQHLVPERAARHAEDVADLVRRIGPLTTEEVRARTREEVRREVEHWLGGLEGARRLVRVVIAGESRWAVVEDAGRLMDGLGVAIPGWVPEAFTAPVDDPIADLAARYARSHGPFAAREVAARLGVGEAVARDALRRLVAAGRVAEGRIRPPSLDPGHGPAPDYCDAAVLRLLKRRSLAALRSQVEPVSTRDLARFLPAWQALTDDTGRPAPGLRGVDGLLRAIEQLAGVRLPAGAVESFVLPARVAGYTPSMLDELLSSGAVVWQGHGALGSDDGWISLHPADTAHLTLSPPRDPDEAAENSEAGGARETGEGSSADPSGALRARLHRVLATGGGYFFAQLAEGARAPAPEADQDPGSPGPSSVSTSSEVEGALWDLVWQGRVSNDTFAPVRALLAGGRGTQRTRRTAPRRASRYGRPPRLGRLGGLRSPGLGTEPLVGSGSGTGGSPGSGRAPDAVRGSPRTVGRWSLLPVGETDPTARALATAEMLLDRHGVVTRGAVTAEETPGGFAAVYRVLAAAEEAGVVRRGYLVEHLGASQFATAGAIDRLRAMARPLESPDEAAPFEGNPPEAHPPEALVVAATDPANPFGAALPWPEPAEAGSGHRPGRKAGALVVILDGRLVCFVERGGHTLLTFAGTGAGGPEDEAALHRAAARALASLVRKGVVDRLTITSCDGAPTLGSEHPLVLALTEAGFHTTTRGLRMRRA